jgi:hypothetical protein
LPKVSGEEFRLLFGCCVSRKVTKDMFNVPQESLRLFGRLETELTDYFKSTACELTAWMPSEVINGAELSVNTGTPMDWSVIASIAKDESGSLFLHTMLQARPFATTVEHCECSAVVR